MSVNRNKLGLERQLPYQCLSVVWEYEIKEFIDLQNEVFVQVTEEPQFSDDPIIFFPVIVSALLIWFPLFVHLYNENHSNISPNLCFLK